MIHVTEHAIDRFIERIRFCDREVARATIAAAERAVEVAASFGASTVKTAQAKLVLQGTTVVTVMPRNWIENWDLDMVQRLERKQEHRQRALRYSRSETIQ